MTQPAAEPETSELDVDLIGRRLISLDQPPIDSTRGHVSLRTERLPDGVSAQIVNSNALGIELVVAPDVAPSLGAWVKVEGRDEEQPIQFVGSVVAVRSLATDRVQLAVRIHERSMRSAITSERRKEVRWHCSSQYYPTGVASNPSKYNDFVYFRVQDVSRSGMRLLTSMRNKFIAREMILDSIVSFPMVSQVTLKLKVGNVSITTDEGKDYLSVGAAFVNLTESKFHVISQYLAQFGDESVVRSMKDTGIVTPALSRGLEFSFVRSATDYREVLELRRVAYAAQGKIAPGTSSDEMSDIFDSRSRIVVCKLRGQIVASARLTFHEQNDLMEHEEYMASSSELPRRDESVEVTRACTHPDYRGARLFFPLLGFIVMTALQADRNWVITSSTSDLVDLYERIGMVRLKETYMNPMLNNATHYLLVGSAKDAVLGRSVGPIVWNLVWKRPSEFAIRSLELPVDPVSRVRLLLYRLVAPLVPLVSVAQGLLGQRRSVIR